MVVLTNIFKAPEQVGLCSERLGRITGFMEDAVGNGRLPMIQTLVARHGHVVYKQGFSAGETCLAEDAIFRIFSMTKPIASLALMMLYEEGKFQLGDPVSRSMCCN
jgi:CubicO group peptidase (beta-lactamase class C family)